MYVQSVILYIFLLICNFSCLYSQVQTVALSCDEQEVDVHNRYWARGHVHAIINDRLEMSAQELMYDAEKKVIKGHGSQACPLVLIVGGLKIRCKFLECDMQTEQCQLQKCFVQHKGYRFTADRASIAFDQKGTLYNVRCTSCKKKNPHWEFLADTVRLADDQRLFVRGAACRLGNYISIPLPINTLSYSLKPCSGFLFPSFFNEKRGGWGIQIPYYSLVSESFDAKHTFYAQSKKGISLTERVRFFSSDVTGQMYGGYGFLWGYDDGVELVRLDRPPFFLHGNLYGKVTNEKVDVWWYFDATEGHVVAADRLMFQPLFWLHQNTYYTFFSAIHKNQTHFFLYNDFLFDSTVTSSVEGDVIQVGRVYDSYFRGPAISCMYDLYMSECISVQPRCIVDVLIFNKEQVRVTYPYQMNQYYLPGERNILLRDATLRLQGGCEIHTFLRGKDFVWHTEIMPGFVAYHKHVKESGNQFCSFQMKTSWTLPEYLVIAQRNDYRIHNVLEMRYQPFISEADNLFEGYDAYDYRYHELSFWFQHRTTLQSGNSYGYWEYVQGLDFSDYQKRDMRTKGLQQGIAFPWRSYFCAENLKCGYRVSAEGEWGQVKSLMQAFSVTAWHQCALVRCDITYAYLSSDIAQVRRLRDAGHFCVCGLQLHLSRFEGLYQGWWQLSSNGDSKPYLYMKKQHAKISWSFDCWRWGFGVEYEQYAVADIPRHYWRLLFSIQLLFSD